MIDLQPSNTWELIYPRMDTINTLTIIKQTWLTTNENTNLLERKINQAVDLVPEHDVSERKSLDLNYEILGHTPH